MAQTAAACSSHLAQTAAASSGPERSTAAGFLDCSIAAARLAGRTAAEHSAPCAEAALACSGENTEAVDMMAESSQVETALAQLDRTLGLHLSFALVVVLALLCLIFASQAQFKQNPFYF